MHLSRLKILRESNELTPEDLAKLLNITEQKYLSFEKDFTLIPVEYLVSLAKFYKTSVDYIVGLSDKNEPYPPAKKPH